MEARIWLRAEAVGILLLAAAGGLVSGAPWHILVAVALAPDLSIIGYAAGPRVGAVIYNLAHTYATPGVLILFAWSFTSHILLGMGAVWAAHIAFDRMLGYGLKLP